MLPIVFRNVRQELAGVRFVIHPATVMLQAVGDNEIVYAQHHVVTRNLGKYLLGDFDVWGFVFHNDARTGLPVVDHRVATLGRAVQRE